MDRLSCWIADHSAKPAVQVAFVLVCLAWLASGLPVEILTMVLSIAAITLTQMVLNSQMHREEDTHRRDVALHAKLDELIRVTSEARDDLMQAEQKTEQEIEQLRG